MFVFLLLVFVAEIAVVVAIGQTIGLLTTIVLLVAVSVVGVAMLRRQGTRTLTSFNEALRSRRDPSPEMVDGMLVGVAAALVLFPGFVSDVLALLLLFPPTRAVVRRRVLRRAAERQRQHSPVIVVDSEVVYPDRAPRPGTPMIIESEREDRD
ncbi:FxsA family protein [Actinophytocola sp. S1-96]|uniref:FxsA family protein n=1 Tax=Actinophytocola gossypii TaxID=2812003 RepID=A0ABT2JES4_9PSEU|nr:FxsA family protein [Actinophytocola gossypii]